MSSSWRFDPAVDARAFELLGYAAASAGISRTQRENRDGWWAHARRNRGFILDAAARVAQPRLAVVLGAGKAYDLPLPELAARFERVLLIDIDVAAMDETLAAAVPDAALRARLEPKAVDLTGVTARLASGIAQALDSKDPLTSLESLCRSYRLEAPPRWFAERADLIVSSMVLSQLGLQPKLAAKHLFEKRFGPIAPGDESRWSAWNELELRLQQDHIEALAAHADLAVLTTDVVQHSGGESWSSIGAARLEDRIPPALEIVARGGWDWARIKAGPEGAALRTEVGAVLLQRREEEVVANP